MSDDASTLAQWIAEAHDIVFFGGAGVSTESGIPDFRGAKGIYHQEREIPLERVLSIDFFSACPGAYYAWFAEETAREGVAPNAAHRFLAGLERAGKLKAVITQNIDGLHQAAGSKRVLELHGNWTRLECTGCGARSTIDDFDEARAGRVPHCPSCSAVVRPDIVFYGEALEPATLEGAVLAIAGADMLIVGGTSLAVYPAAGLIDYYQGGRLVLMNATPTPYDGRADLIIREPIGRVFAQIQGHV